MLRHWISGGRRVNVVISACSQTHPCSASGQVVGSNCPRTVWLLPRRCLDIIKADFQPTHATRAAQQQLVIWIFAMNLTQIKLLIKRFVAHSEEWAYAIVRRPSSVCLSVRLSVNILRKSLLPDKWLDRHQTCTRWFPEGPASRVCSRSRSRSKTQRSRDTGTLMSKPRNELLRHWRSGFMFKIII